MSQASSPHARASSIHSSRSGKTLPSDRGVVLRPPWDLMNDDEGLIVCADAEELVERLWRKLRLAAPAADRAIARFGLGRVERALIQTLASVEGGRLRNPAGYLLSTLDKGLDWTAAQVQRHLEVSA